MSHGPHASVWTILTFHIASFSEKQCPVAFFTDMVQTEAYGTQLFSENVASFGKANFKL